MKRRDHDIDHLLRETLDDSGTSPDQTRRIMNRLGYMQCAPAVVRRRRIMRILARVTVGMMIAFVLVGTYAKLQQTPSVRRPQGPTLPAAFKQEVEHQRTRFERLLESLPQIEPNSSLEPTDEVPELQVVPGSDLDRSAMALVRWM